MQLDYGSAEQANMNFGFGLKKGPNKMAYLLYENTFNLLFLSPLILLEKRREFQ